MSDRVVVDIRTLGDTVMRMGIAFVESTARQFDPIGKLVIMTERPPTRTLVCMKVKHIEAAGLGDMERSEKDCADCGETVGYSPSLGEVPVAICPECFTKRLASASAKDR